MKNFNSIILNISSIFPVFLFIKFKNKIILFSFLTLFFLGGIFGFADSVRADLTVGTRCADGKTVYVNPTLRTTLVDAGNLNWQTAVDTCAAKGAGWHLPTSDELHSLYLNRTSIGGFVSNLVYSLYWSSEEDGPNAHVENFFNGYRAYWYSKLSGPAPNLVYTRCVQTVATDVYCSGYVLNITKTGTGSGTVTGAGTYTSGVVVTAIATPNIGSTFSGWSGDCNTSGQVTMTSAKTCTATFTLANYPLTINKTGTGSGIVIGAGTYPAGTVVTPTATPSSNSIFYGTISSKFSGWSGDCNTSGQVTMTSAKTCFANFNLITLTITKAGTGSGTVTGAGTYDVGTLVTATATADPGSTFSGWSGDCNSSGQARMTYPRTCIATFNIPVLGTPCLDGSIYINPTLRISTTYDMSQTYIEAKTTCIDKGSGWRLPTKNELITIIDNKNAIGGWSTCTDHNPLSTPGATCYPNFFWSSTTSTNGWIVFIKSILDGWELTPQIDAQSEADARCVKTVDASTDCAIGYFLNITKIGTGSGTVTGVGAYTPGTFFTATATADPGSTFSGWSGDCNSSGQVTMTSAKTCTATFTLANYPLTINKTGTGSGTVIGAGTYSHGTTTTATATADAGSTFSGWSGDCNSSGQVTMNSAKTCTATFNLIPTVTLIANPISIIAGTSSKLTWNVTNAISCLSTGAEVLWSGSTTLATSTGSWPTGILNTVGGHIYGITCTGPGGIASATTTVSVNPTPIPTVIISANPPSIIAGARSFITWTVANVTSCVATGETPYWAGSDVTLHSVPYPWPTGILNEDRTYVYGITCTGPGGIVSATTTVNVDTGTIENPVVSGGTDISKCQAIDVSWNDYPGADSYDVICVVGGNNSICSSGPNNSVTIRNLTPDTNYSFIIKAYSSGTEIASATTATVKSGPICTGPTGSCSISKDLTPSYINKTTTWTASSTPPCLGCTYSWSGTDINPSPAPTSNPFPMIYTTVGTKNINVLVKNSVGGKFCTTSSATTVSFSGGTTEER